MKDIELLSLLETNARLSVRDLSDILLEEEENIIQRMQLPIGKCNRDNQNQCKRIQCYFIQTVKNGKQSSVMKGGQK